MRRRSELVVLISAFAALVASGVQPPTGLTTEALATGQPDAVVVHPVSLPDLSHMKVKTYVNEVDVDKLEVGQKALIKLDALSEPTFHGSITSIASLGREKEGEKNVKVFDIEVEIDEDSLDFPKAHPIGVG